MKYATDKFNRYGPTYRRIFRELKGKGVRVLEVGVAEGGGMEMFENEFFPPPGKVYGYDRANPTLRPNVFVGNQIDVERLREVGSDGWDVVIDDASHVGEYTRTTFWTLFPYLRRGGIYIIEDWDTAYRSSWYDGKNLRPRRKLHRWGLRNQLFGRYAKIFARRKIRSHQWGMAGFAKELLDWRDEFASVEFVDWQIIVRKK